MNYLLYTAYLGFYICLFSSNDFFLADNVFLYIVVPLALLPVEISYTSSLGGLDKFVVRFDPRNLHYTFMSIKSPIFMAALGFGGVVVLSSALQPSWSLEWSLDMSRYLISIACFMLITARLSLYFDNFYEKFFFFLSLLASLNAVINLYEYYLNIFDFNEFSLQRFAPSFGRIPDHFPTTGAMTYASCLVGASTLLVMKISSLQKKILGLCVVILFVGLTLTQSRGPLLGALVAIAVSCLNAQQATKYLSIILPIAAASVFFLISNIGQTALQRLDSNRLEVWDVFLFLANERAFLGYGERIQFVVEMSDGAKLGHAHNIYINSIMRGGLLAGMFIVVAYCNSLIKTFYYAREYSNPVPLGLILLASIAGLFDFDQLVFLADWQWVSFWMPLGIAASCDTRRRLRVINLSETFLI